MSNSRPIADAHCDTLLRLVSQKRRLADPGEGQIDLDRLVASPVGLQFFALFVPPEFGEDRGFKYLLKMVAAFRREVAEHPDLLRPVRARADLVGEGVGGLLSVEGLDVIGDDIDLLDLLHELGVRSALLTWNGRNRLADGALDQGSGGGLSDLGREAVRRMEGMGILPDASHLSEASFWDLMQTAGGPVIASHSNCRALHDHPRNLRDDQIRAVAERGGVIGVTFFSDFLGDGDLSADVIFRHIDHMLSVGGEESVAFGSDFDGIPRWPEGIDDVTSFGPLLERMDRLYGPAVSQRIAGGNLRAVLDRTLP